MITENIRIIQERIRSACKRVERDPKEVTLVAVSKTKPVSDMELVLSNRIEHFGENKVQEICDKYPQLENTVKWHMIGHLQRNKVKQVIDKVHLIHSVDSFRLAEQIQKEAEKNNLHMNILIQVNVANEESKFGVQYDDTIALIQNISTFSNIHVEGLMTVAPFVDSPEKNRKYFKKLRQLYIDIKSENIDNVNMNILSMGMSNDFEIAIEEGATLVRIGTGIFGNRKYS